MPEESSDSIKNRNLFVRRTIVYVALASSIYFIDIFLRSYRKPFWFDELFTVYLCRLPSMRDTWIAVQHGADFNPPLFYILTRASQALFGHGNIAIRLPETLGIWVFCLSLFVFIARPCGRVAAGIGALFPLFTLAHYYAYEARPHGITLGWCGLALLCWQRIAEGHAKLIWHLGFIAVVLGSVLTHVYAIYLFVPFTLFEMYSLVRLRKMHWSVAVGIGLAATVAFPIYLPLMRTYQAMMPPVADLPTGSIQHALRLFAVDSLGKSSILFLVCVALSILSLGVKHGRLTYQSWKQHRPRLEPISILALGFLFIPVIGIAVARHSHVSTFHRYYLSYLAGLSILLGEATRLWGAGSRRAFLLLTIATSMLLADLGTVSINMWRGKEDGLTEPSSGFAFFAYPRDALDQDVHDLNVHPELPILDLSAPMYLYLYHYAPKEVVDRLSFGAPAAQGLFLDSYRNMAEWGRLPLKLSDTSHFLDSHDRFYTFQSTGSLVNGCDSCIRLMLQRGYTRVSQASTPDGLISEFARGSN